MTTRHHTDDDFVFLAPDPLIDSDLKLVLVERIPARPAIGHVPCYHFAMRSTKDGAHMGDIYLRIGVTHNLIMYGGQIGYGVAPAHRGHHYAARSVRLVLPLARAHGLDPLWITCDPDNMASRRSCELAGGQLVEIVDVPPGTEEYNEGKYQKCRYRFDLF